LSLQEVAEEFDVVICSEVLEHLSDPLTFLQLLSQRVAAHGRLVVATPNGYGYGEIERRILYAGFELAQGLPLPVKKWLLRGKRMSREWLKARKSMPAVSASPLSPPIMETLNFRDNIHVQRFSLTRLTRLLRKAGLDVEQVYNVQCLGGVAGSLLERKLPLDRWLDRMPAMMVADWMFVCRGEKCGQVNRVVLHN
jgi:SAM-dependent methyltransferase